MYAPNNITKYANDCFGCRFETVSNDNCVCLSFTIGSDVMPKISRIVPCLWFNGQAEQAAGFYVSIFPNSKLGSVSRYSEAGKEFHGQEPGTALTVAFELDGQSFTGLNGGPLFTFSEAISFQINCDTQEEIDYYWGKLSEGGDPNAQQCGWLKDQFGLSWQVVPNMLAALMSGETTRSQQAMQALMQMKKLDIAALQNAYDS